MGLWQVGPRKSFATAWSANAVSICASCGLGKVTRLEASRRFRLRSAQALPSTDIAAFAALVHDRMTEEVRRHCISCTSNQIVKRRIGSRVLNLELVLNLGLYSEFWVLLCAAVPFSLGGGGGLRC